MFKILVLSFTACFVFERLFTGWHLPTVKSWYVRVLLTNTIQLIVVLTAGFTWEKWLSATSIFQLSENMNAWAAGFLAYFIATFVFYWWHRLRHDSDFLWRTFHQMHHSPQRLEVITSFYKHPLEMIANSLLGSILVYSILGLDLKAGTIYTLFTALGEFFYHTNIRTPRWVGYFFQRPEMHRVHHQYNRHKNNYGDFVFWDMLFGTYENPKTWDGNCGFDERNELRVKEMLKLKDIHRPVSFVLTFLFLTSSSAEANATKFSSWDEACSKAQNLVAEGDIVFLDIPNILFRNVAASTRSWTSHIGIVFKDDKGNWIVSESKVPFATETLLCKFLKRSSQYNFEIKRLNRTLLPAEINMMRTRARGMLNGHYDLGFDFDSPKLFCSKFVYLTYKAIDIEVGKIQTFRQLLSENPGYSPAFWQLFFFGKIPWERRTVTPASQLNDGKFISVLKTL